MVTKCAANTRGRLSRMHHIYFRARMMSTLFLLATSAFPQQQQQQSLAHLASGGHWKTTITLTNTGTTWAQVHLQFIDDNGHPLTLPLSFPQTNSGPSLPPGGGRPVVLPGTPLLASTLDRTLNSRGSYGASILNPLDSSGVHRIRIGAEMAVSYPFPGPFPMPWPGPPLPWPFPSPRPHPYPGPTFPFPPPCPWCGL
jgi:hypothetical protein